MAECIVCQSLRANRQQGAGDFVRFECVRCGVFALSESAESVLPNLLGEAPARRAIMSHTLRRAEARQGSSVHIIASDELPSYWARHRLPSTQEQANNLVLWIGDNQPSPGARARTTLADYNGLNPKQASTIAESLPVTRPMIRPAVKITIKNVTAIVPSAEIPVTPTESLSRWRAISASFSPNRLSRPILSPWASYRPLASHQFTSMRPTTAATAKYHEVVRKALLGVGRRRGGNQCEGGKGEPPARSLVCPNAKWCRKWCRPAKNVTGTFCPAIAQSGQVFGHSSRLVQAL
jgi:hypothetical protein